MTEYRVCKTIMLEIAKHCDLETLSAFSRTNRDIHSLIFSFERHISMAKLKQYLLPPLSPVLSSPHVSCCAISERNSFATVQEFELREKRMRQIFETSGFFLTGHLEVFGMTRGQCEKLKAGLKRALYIADRLSDLAADPSITRVHGPQTTVLERLLMEVELRHAGAVTGMLRNLQSELIRSLSTLDLALLLTLVDGVEKGYARYKAGPLRSDPSAGEKRMAMREVVLRHGTLILWGFIRGPGPVSYFVDMCVAACADEIVLWQSGRGGPDMADGLHMTMVRELKDRVAAMKRGEEGFDEGSFTPPDFSRQVAKIVAEEIGCEGWDGYLAVDHP